MAITSNMLPSKCCCCSVRAGSIVIGTFALIIALTFLGLSALASSLLGQSDCTSEYANNSWKTTCVVPNETRKMVANLMAILAILNAMEAVMSIGLIWGASKKIVSWVTGWLIVSASWILLHSTIAVTYAFAATNEGFIALIAVIGILTFGLALVSMLTVLSFRREITITHQ